MISLNELENALEEICPLAQSVAAVQDGAYDNSGTLVRMHEKVGGIMFSLDLNVAAVTAASEQGADTIITHHPAIYEPLKHLDCRIPAENALLAAVHKGMNVISMHLNLDMTAGGIDDSLAEALGAEEFAVIEKIGEHGYGREFAVTARRSEDYVAEVKKRLHSDRIMFYGEGEVKKVASFCGGGAHDAAAYDGDADLVVTSDCPHHLIAAILGKGRKLMLLTHYAAEFYGFEKFYAKVGKALGNRVGLSLYRDDVYL